MITNRVKEYREEIGLTQAELSERAGISRTMISKLETNQKVDCKVSTLLAIASVLGKPVGDIFLT
ncbi:MAG: helix-turn-helix transcriptional regulator [Oscillospiraceae bacterium]|nr:helix-turn-helix transcriptional regulator [Oscillospiraceae bacterium]